MHSQNFDPKHYYSSEVWNAIQDNLKTEFGDLVFKNWLSKLWFAEFNEGVLTISAPTRFIKEWVITNYLKVISNICKKIEPSILRVDVRHEETINEFVCVPSIEKIDSAYTEDDLNCDIMSYQLDPKFTFDNFVTADSNKAAYTAAKAIADGIDLHCNIVYIHSAVGNGKTHLLQSIASEIKTKHKRKRVAYLSADKFIYLYVKAIRSNELVSFKEKLRSADVLLIDDIQFVCGKNSTQNELGQTLCALAEANKKVVVSSDVSPFQLELDQRSKSRLSGGVVVNILPSSIEHRIEILKSKALIHNLDISADVINFIAKNISGSIRELEGALNKVISHTKLFGGEITLDSAKEILKENVYAVDRSLSLKNIMLAVCTHFKITESDIKSSSRAARFSYPRQIYFYLTKKLTTESIVNIGKSVGDRGHTTVIYAINKLTGEIASDVKISRDIESIEARLGL
jgi:chromosomal replication initiator protein